MSERTSRKKQKVSTLSDIAEISKQITRLLAGRGSDEIELQSAAQYGKSAEEVILELGNNLICCFFTSPGLWVQRYSIDYQQLQIPDQWDPVDNSTLNVVMDSTFLDDETARICFDAIQLLMNQRVVPFPHRIYATYEIKSGHDNIYFNGVRSLLPLAPESSVFKMNLILKIRFIDEELRAALSDSLRTVERVFNTK